MWQLLALYRPSASAMVIDGSNTTSTQQKLLALRYITVYAKLVKKDKKGTLYSSHWKCKLLEITKHSKKAEVSSNFSSYQMLTMDKNSWRNYKPEKLVK